MCKRKDPALYPQLIAITGGLGSGKSSVLSILKAKGYECIDVDQFAKEVLEHDQGAINEVIRHFGEDALRSDRKVDRKRLREMIIADEEKRSALEAIIHPRVMARLRKELCNCIEKGQGPYIFVEVPLLFEVGWERYFDLVVCVRADVEKSVARIARRHNIDASTARDWLSLQMSIEEKMKRSQYVIENSGDRGALVQAVEKMLEWLEQEKAACRRCC